jgi:hypothetical protein
LKAAFAAEARCSTGVQIGDEASTMSLHVGALLARGNALSEMKALCDQAGCAMSEAPISLAVPFDDLMQRRLDECGLALIGGWTVLWGHSGLLSPSLDFVARAPNPRLYATAEHLAPALAALSGSREVYFSISDGTAGTYGLDLYTGGHRTRSLWEIEGEVVRDEGAPLSEEAEFRKRLATSEWGMIELLCHQTVPYSTLEQSTLDVWRIAWVPVKSRSWWQLW